MIGQAIILNTIKSVFNSKLLLKVRKQLSFLMLIHASVMLDNFDDRSPLLHLERELILGEKRSAQSNGQSYNYKICSILNYIRTRRG